MNPMDRKETERLLKGIELNPSPQLERRMRALWAEADGKEPARATRREEARRHGFSRKRLLRVGATVAAVCVALLAGWCLLSGRGVMPSAYAELMEAARNSQAAEWVHATGTAGGQEVEGWLSLRPFRTFMRRGDQVEAADAEAHREYKYDPATNTVTVLYLAEAPEEMLQASSFMAAMLAQLERAEQEGLIEITKRHVLVDGRKYEVYTVTLNNEEAMEATLTVDSSTQRLVRIESQACPPGGCGPMELAFDYPDSGPADIYALGVPRDARIVENLPTTDLLQLHEEVEQARSSFAPSYRALIWRGHVSGNVGPYQLDQLVVLYKKDGRCRMEWGREPAGLSLPGRGFEELIERLPADDGAALEKWAEQVAPRDVYFNENSIRSKGVRVSLSPEGELQRDTTQGVPGGNTVEDLTWSSAIHKTGEKAFPGKEGQFGSLLCTGYDVQGYVYDGEIAFPSRIRRSWNPARDYAREEMEQLEDVNAPWQEDQDWMKGADPDLIKRRWLSDLDEMKNYRGTRTSRIVEYGQTPEGRWYAKRIVHESTSNLRASSPQMVVVHLDTEADIPDELLDPESVTSEMLATWGVSTPLQAEFDKAMAIVDGRDTWPATPREVAEAYWKARNAKDWGEMAVLWPGSAAWHRILADEAPVEYVFGEAEGDTRSNQIVVAYAAKDYYEKHGTYNLKMRLSNDKSSKGRYYVVSGN